MNAPGLVALGLVLAHPVVIDGDTLRDGETRYYRVENIDAPERRARAECLDERVLAEASRAYLTAWIERAHRIEAAPAGARKVNFCSAAGLLPAAR